MANSGWAGTPGDMLQTFSASPTAAASTSPETWASQTIERIPGVAGTRLLVLCDHAGTEVPGGFETLGVAAAERERHIAFDIGAAWTARRLAQRLDAAAILNHNSRLYVDPNRRPLSEHSIPTLSDGTLVPANSALSGPERALRHRMSFWPYHHAIAQQLGSMHRDGLMPCILAIHSFTPWLNGLARPWDLGILHDEDRRLSEPVLHALHRHGELLIGDNEPYSGLDAFGFTISFHAQRTGFPHLMVELRQDRVASQGDAEAHADLLAEVLAPALQSPTLNALQPHSRRTWREGPLNARVY